MTHTSRCSNAKNPECNCSCKGRYHRTIGKAAKTRIVKTPIVQLQVTYLCAENGCYSERLPNERYCETHKALYKGQEKHTNKINNSNSSRYIVPSLEYFGVI